MTNNNKHLDTMYNSNNNNNTNSTNKKQPGDAHTITRMHPSMKRPRAPIACYRCHHKKVRCDGIHPNCTRCQSTGILCAYPSSRRSRNTQPTNVDPFIDNLSQLEVLIRRIETDLESQRQLLRTVCESDLSDGRHASEKSSTLTSRMLKTEKDLQESRSIVAQLRLRGEQRAARGRRAAAAAAAAAATTTSTTSSNSTPTASSIEKGAGYSGKRKSSSMSTDVNSTVLNTGKHRGSTGTVKHNRQSIKKEIINTDFNADVNNLSHYATTPITTSSSSSPPPPSFYFTPNGTTPSPNDFIHPSSTYYFPYTSSTTTSVTGDISHAMCNVHPSAPFTMAGGPFQDWNLLGDLPHSTATVESGFVDPMIIAAASEAHHSIHPTPMLSVSNYDTSSSIMANKARALSHLPNNATNGGVGIGATIALPGLQPSSSSTSTNSSTSSSSYYSPNSFESNHAYNQFIGEEMMIDTQNN